MTRQINNNIKLCRKIFFGGVGGGGDFCCFSSDRNFKLNSQGFFTFTI